MEQKKTLWILVGVGIFLAIVIGSACIFYTPSAHSVPTVTNISPVEKAGTSGWVQNSSNTSLPEESENNEQIVSVPATNVSDMFVISENTSVYGMNQQVQEPKTIDLNALKNELSAAIGSEQKSQNINITVNVPENTGKTFETNYSINQETVSVQETEKEQPVKQQQPKKTESAKTQEPKKTAAKPAKTAQPKSTGTKSETKSTTKPAETQKKVVQYWVQVAAFSNKKSAEDARSSLDANKIPSDIFTYKDNKGKLFYRVRVGPYTTKSEAEYWRTRIMKIAEFSDTESYVTSTETAQK